MRFLREIETELAVLGERKIDINFTPQVDTEEALIWHNLHIKEYGPYCMGLLVILVIFSDSKKFPKNFLIKKFLVKQIRRWNNTFLTEIIFAHN